MSFLDSFGLFFHSALSPAIVDRLYMATFRFNHLILGTPLINTFAFIVRATITYTHHALVALILIELL
jgi:hypothetical protein